MSTSFDYMEGFSRNLGWLSEYEQVALKKSRVAIAGMGGVGGIYLLTCVRLGIEKFNLSDFDTFEMGNFNRQVGSSMSTLGKSKLDVMIQQALDINPNLQINRFQEGITDSNINDFLKDCSVYLDGIDFFEIYIRRCIFKRCQELNIPAITVAPIAMGFAQLIFADKSPAFDDFFDFNSYEKEFHPLVFLMGMAPKNLQGPSMHDLSRIHFKEKKVTSTIMGCQLCAGVAVTEALKYILDRGHKIQAPHGLHYDAHANKMKKTFLRWGNKGPLQRLKIKIAIKIINEKNKFPYPYKPSFKNTILLKPVQDILNDSLWAPSGHNEHTHDMSPHTPNEILVQLHHPNLPFSKDELEKISLIHFGVYFETLKQAASLRSYSVSWQQTNKPLQFLVSFHEDDKIQAQDSALYLRARFTDRRKYSSKKIDPFPYQDFKDELHENYKVLFHDSFQNRLEYALHDAKVFSILSLDNKLLSDMVSSLDFHNPYSPNGIPFESLAFSKIHKPLSKILMQYPKIMRWLNKCGLYFPVMIDYAFIRNMKSAGQFMLVRTTDPNSKPVDQFIRDGQMIQRFWLKAASLGFVLQPSYFQLFIGRNEYFQDHPHQGIRKKAHKLLSFISKRSLSCDPSDIVFTGRIGFPTDRKVYARSTRRPPISDGDTP